jgi:[acyl-carrier-protein] S-malonyltransferase
LSESSKIAFIYPGQGSQYPGMGKTVYDAFPEARRVFEQADAALPMSITELCFAADEDTLRLTENTQPAILTVSAALHRVLAESGLRPDWVAGHSLGEYSALVAAGALDVGSAAALVHKRGRYMQEAVPEGEGSMAAILGLDDDEMTRICAAGAGGAVVEVANLNAPGQVVIAGHRAAVEAAVAAAQEAGARRAIMLNVSAPFHCSLMQPAADRLAPELAAAPFAEPDVPVVCNVDAAAVTSGDAARDALRRQVTSPVRWAETLQFLAAQGVDTFVEVGPGRVLSGLVKRTLGRDVAIYSVDEREELDAVVQALE